MDQNKIEEKDWELIRDNLEEKAYDMEISDLVDWYVNLNMEKIKQDERLEFFDIGWLPCKSCENFRDDCECEEQKEVA